jgi:hypothetical protein
MLPMRLYLCFALLLCFQTLIAQSNSIDYNELPDPQRPNIEQWKAMDKPVAVSFASSDVRYGKRQIPSIEPQKSLTISAWRGEKVNVQALIWTNQDLSEVSIASSDFKHKKGTIIPKAQVQSGFLRYVMTDVYVPDCPAHVYNQYDSSLVADVIDPISKMNVAANSTQPIWFSISIPDNVPAGLYKGKFLVSANQQYTLNLSIQVAERRLPPPNEWAFDLDYWQHPAAIARVHGVPLWSQAHYDLMRPYYLMLAAAGQKNVTTTIIHEPWNHQTYDDFPSLIQWTKRRDGSWQFDYSLFDRYVAFVMDCGINKRINCYTLIPWKLSFQYYDETIGRDTALNAAPGSAEYTAHWTTMLQDFTRHLKAKGWFEKTFISMDERPAEAMAAVIKLLKSVDKDWKITLAGGYHPEIEQDLFDYSLASAWKFDLTLLANRKKSGKTATFYTCCVEEYPNGFTFSPPAESAWLGWYAAAEGFTGYLRWAYNSWTQYPLQDSRFRAWAGGDTYQVYPGPRSSVRFEKLIEGIQAFEKIRLLRAEYTRLGNVAALDKLDNTLKVFKIEALKGQSAGDMIRKAEKELGW